MPAPFMRAVLSQMRNRSGPFCHDVVPTDLRIQRTLVRTIQRYSHAISSRSKSQLSRARPRIGNVLPLESLLAYLLYVLISHRLWQSDRAGRHLDKLMVLPYPVEEASCPGRAV